MNKIPVRKLKDSSSSYFPITVPETVILNKDIEVRGNVGGYSQGVVIPAETSLQTVLEQLVSGSNGGSSNVKVDDNSIIKDNTQTISVAKVKDVYFHKQNNTVFKIIEFIGGKFYAGNDEGLYCSEDSENWTKLVFDKSFSVNVIYQANGVINFGGKSNNKAIIGYSTDNGCTFKLCDLESIESSIKEINRIEFEPDREVWVASNHSSQESKYYYYSWNGIDWKSNYIHTKEDSSVQFTLCSVKCMNHKWYAHGWTSRYITSFVTSDPSKEWKKIDSLLLDIPGDQPHIHSFAYSNGTYMAGYLNYNKGIYHSRNGENWIKATANESNGSTAKIVTNGLYCYNNVWFALDEDKGIMVSNDLGISWASASYKDNSVIQISTDNINQKLWYHNGIAFVICETGVAYTSDGITWIHKDFNSSKVYDIQYVNSKWIFATSSGIYTSTIKCTEPVIIDNDLDDESTNPVENRAVTKRIKELCTVNNVAEILDTRSMPTITTNGYWKVYDHSGNMIKTVNSTVLNIEDGFQAIWTGEYYYDNSNTTRKRVDFTQVAGVDVEPTNIGTYNYGEETTDVLTKSTSVISIKNRLADKISIDSVANKFKSDSTAKVNFTNYYNITRRPAYCNINSYTSNYLRMDEGNPDIVVKTMPMDFGWGYNTSKTSMAIWTPASWGLNYLYRYMLHEKINNSIYMVYPSSSNVSAVSNLCRKYRNIVTGQFRMFPYPEYNSNTITADDKFYILHSNNYYKKVIKYKDNGKIKYLIDYKVSSDPFTVYRFDNDDLYIKCKDNTTNNIVYIKPQYKMNVAPGTTDTVVYVDGKCFQVNKTGCLIMNSEGYQILSGSTFDKNSNSINRNPQGVDIDYILDNYNKVVFMENHDGTSSSQIIWNKSDYPTIEDSNVKIFTRTVTDQRTGVTSDHVCVTNGTKEFDITVGGLQVQLTDSNGGVTTIHWVPTKDIIALNMDDKWFIRRQNFNIKLEAGVYLNNGHDKAFMTSESEIVNGEVTYSADYDSNRYVWLDNDIFYVEVDPELIGVIDENSNSTFYHYVSSYGHVIAKAIEFNHLNDNSIVVTDNHDSFDHKVCQMSTPSGQWLAYDVYVVNTPRFTPINERIYYANEETKLTARWYPSYVDPSQYPLDGEIFSLNTTDECIYAATQILDALQIDSETEPDDNLYECVQNICNHLNLDYTVDNDDILTAALTEILNSLGAEVVS